MIELTLTSAVLIGLLGSTHCLGMCGGISAALSLNDQPARHLYVLTYNIGRLLTYTAIGALAGAFGAQLISASPQMALLLRTVAGLLLIAMGLYVSQLWMGLTRLEKAGAYLWRYIQPLTKPLLPVKNQAQALQLGILWGLLPCGLVYSTLSWALATGHWQQSALLMLAFGVGTLPAMLSMGLLNQQLLSRLRGKNFRVVAGVLIIAMGLATILIPVSHQRGGHDHGQHGNHSNHIDHSNHSM